MSIHLMSSQRTNEIQKEKTDEYEIDAIETIDCCLY